MSMAFCGLFLLKNNKLVLRTSYDELFQMMNLSTVVLKAKKEYVTQNNFRFVSF